MVAFPSRPISQVIVTDTQNNMGPIFISYRCLLMLYLIEQTRTCCFLHFTKLASCYLDLGQLFLDYDLKIGKCCTKSIFTVFLATSAECVCRGQPL